MTPSEAQAELGNKSPKAPFRWGGNLDIVPTFDGDGGAGHEVFMQSLQG